MTARIVSGRWQAWIHASPQPLPPAVATLAARHLAQLYGADRASADWRHLGRLVGFTNQKPERRQANGLAPWVKLIYARSGRLPTAPLQQRYLRRSIPARCATCTKPV